MKKILTGILTLLMVGFVSITFAQIRLHVCEEAGYEWDEEQGKCVYVPLNPPKPLCAESEIVVDGKCVPREQADEPPCSFADALAGLCGSGVEPAEALNLPSLEHFTLTESEVSDDEIYLIYAPKGTPHFYLHVDLYNENGRDILSTWCTGDETLCKAVGNGNTCGSSDRTGNNAWCYEGGAEQTDEIVKKVIKQEETAKKLKEVKVTEKVEKLK